MAVDPIQSLYPNGATTQRMVEHVGHIQRLGTTPQRLVQPLQAALDVARQSSPLRCYGTEVTPAPLRWRDHAYTVSGYGAKSDDGHSVRCAFGEDRPSRGWHVYVTDVATGIRLQFGESLLHHIGAHQCFCDTFYRGADPITLALFFHEPTAVERTTLLRIQVDQLATERRELRQTLGRYAGMAQWYGTFRLCEFLEMCTPAGEERLALLASVFSANDSTLPLSEIYPLDVEHTIARAHLDPTLQLGEFTAAVIRGLHTGAIHNHFLSKIPLKPKKGTDAGLHGTKAQHSEWLKNVVAQAFTHVANLPFATQTDAAYLLERLRYLYCYDSIGDIFTSVKDIDRRAAQKEARALERQLTQHHPDIAAACAYGGSPECEMSLGNWDFVIRGSWQLQTEPHKILLRPAP